MRVRYIHKLSNLPENSSVETILDEIENGIESRLRIAIDRNIISFDDKSDIGELSHKLFNIIKDNNADSGDIVLIEVGRCIDNYYFNDGCYLPGNKYRVALFTFENGDVMLGAY